ncbi:Peptidase, M48 family [Alteracholeplasma palmae J233]|uniref:Peptidase, M48 family n=1 Tax=Alteracholeplasma palmae (strain ATCC 49389 / J233) TaxID=1318466 RepID=U4KJP0_ALTPJ|nr:zinc metalloprotease HtpX [Alteracholeplasma palmae]CCV63618.1 Peptidase, M48 family [Alteracholeplasma palmae J233]
MFFLKFLINLFKPRNWGLLVYMAINAFFFTIVFEYLLQLVFKTTDIMWYYIVPVYIILLFIMLSSFGENIFNAMRKMREIPKNSETEHIYELFNEVYSNAKKNNNSISNKVKLYYIDDENINAFAFGRNTIGVTAGSLQLDDEAFKGILAHEFGHLYAQDSHVNLGIMATSFSMQFAIYAVSLLFLFFTYIIDIIITAVLNKTNFGKTEKILLFSTIVIAIRSIIINVWTFIGRVLVSIASRKQEYKADAYASKIGYNEGLYSALTILSEGEQTQSFVNYILYGTHPSTDKRLLALENK